MENLLIELVTYAKYLLLSLVLLGLFVRIYLWITPYDDLAGIRAGNIAIGMSLCGAVLGFMLPLVSAAVHTKGLLEFLLWGLLASATQLLIYVAFARTSKTLVPALEEGNVAYAAVLATFAVTVGLINAASLS